MSQKLQSVRSLLLLGCIMCVVTALAPGMAVVRTDIVDGTAAWEGLVSGATITVQVEVNSNSTSTPVGTYAFQLLYDEASFDFVEVTGNTDFATGGTPSSSTGSVVVSAFSSSSTMVNGLLFEVVFSIDAGATDKNILTHDYGSNPLVTPGFADIEHIFDNRLYEGASAGVKDWRLNE